MSETKVYSFSEERLPEDTLRVFATQEVTSFFDPKEPFELSRYRNAVIDFVDSTLKFTVIKKGNKLHVKVYVRLEHFEEGAINDNNVFIVDIHDDIMDEEKVPRQAMAGVAMLRVICNHIAEKYTEDELDVCKDEIAGLMLEKKDEQLVSRIVIGKMRPELECSDTEGNHYKCRPYADEKLKDLFGLFGSNTLFMNLDELIEAAEEEDEGALDKLYQAYLNGSDMLDVEADVNEAVKWLKKYAETENSNALFNLGLHYMKGFGVERDYKKAYILMQAADENGDDDAAGVMDKLRGIPEKQAAAQKGDAQAAADYARFLMEIALMFEQAGSEKDFKESLIWSRRAAAQNNGDGLWVLGLAYEHGRGVEADMAEAAKHFRKGAELGHAACQCALGNMYLNGDPMPRDVKLGFEWMHKSAMQGDGIAMYNLGRCYQFGTGVEDDMSKAIEWYEKSLEVRPDPELESKVAVFKHLEELTSNVDESEPDDLPPGYMEMLEKITHDYQDDDGVLVKYNGTDAEVDIPYGMQEVGDRAFVLNNHIREVAITPSIHTIGEKAFMGCHNLKQVSLPDTLRVIRDFGFANCEKIEEIDLPDNLEEIGECAFINCEGLKTITIPPRVKVIKSGTFTNCSGLEKVVLPEGITTLEKEAFADCRSLKEINRPASLKTIAPDAFRNCSKLAVSPVSKKMEKDAAKLAEEEKKKKAQEEARRRREAEQSALSEVEALCESKCTLIEKETRNETRKKNLAAAGKAFDQAITAQNNKVAGLQRELASQGFFAFGRKKELRQQIAEEAAKISILNGLKAEATDILQKSIIINAICTLCMKPDQRMTVPEMCGTEDTKVTMPVAQKMNAMKDKGLVVRTEGGRMAAFHLAAYPAPFTMSFMPSEREIEAESLRRIVDGNNLKVKGTLTKESVAKAVSERILAGMWKTVSTPTPTEKENERYKRIILQVLNRKGMTVSEIQAAHSKLRDISNQRLSAILRQMTLNGEIERFEKNRKVYFHL